MNGAEGTPEAAAAVKSAPAPAEASQSSQPPDGGAAPVQLTGYRLRKAREAEKKQKAAEARARREAAKAGRPKPAEKEPAAEESIDEWDEKERAREVGGFWRLVLRIVSLCAWPFGYTLDALTDKECAEDVALLAPLAGRHRWLELLVRYAALPYLLVERIATKAKRREPKKTEPKP